MYPNGHDRPRAVANLNGVVTVVALTVTLSAIASGYVLGLYDDAF
jgi:FlaG/FlaF family flagellin (archaellin)